jgi:anti-sigma factor RsiW
MTCRQIEKLLPPYQEGALVPREKKAVDSHLASCPDCRRLLGFLKQADSALASFPEVEVSRGLMRKLYAVPWLKTPRLKTPRLKAEPKPGLLSFFPRLIRQPAFLPVAAVLLAAVIFVTNPHRDAVLKALNRQVHLGFNTVEKVYAQAGSLLDKLNSYKEDALVSLRRINPLDKNGDK